VQRPAGGLPDLADGARAMTDPSPTDLMRDMDAHLAAIGIDPAAYPWGADLAMPRGYPVRRGARPVSALGRIERREVPADVAARWGRPS
jgi:hypothetical protein